MLLKNRRYTPQPPDRDAKKIYIFCEGVKREKKYFHFFVNLDARVDIIVYDLKDTENNSPKGLVQIAEKALASKDVIENDEIWLVLDTDIYENANRIKELKAVREKCAAKKWRIAQSNPCFEVWLYYHQENQKPNFDNMAIPSVWKNYVDTIIKGGFDARKHPILIETALENAKTNFEYDQNQFPNIACTEVFHLANNILAVGKIKIQLAEMLKNMKK